HLLYLVHGHAIVDCVIGVPVKGWSLDHQPKQHAAESNEPQPEKDEPAFLVGHDACRSWLPRPRRRLSTGRCGNASRGLRPANHGQLRGQEWDDPPAVRPLLSIAWGGAKIIGHAIDNR